MRRSTLTYWIITLAIVVASNQVIGTSKLYKAKISVIDQLDEHLKHALQSDRPITLVIGNSYVAASIPQDSLPADYVRLIEFGMPLENMVQLVDHLPARSNVKRVIVGLGYNYANPMRAGSEMYNVHYASNSMTRLWWSIPLVRGRSLAATVLKNGFLCIVRLGNCSNAPATGAVNEPTSESDLDAAGVHRARNMRASIQDRLRQYVPLLKDISSDFGDEVTAMAAACAERGIDFRAFTAPVHPDLRRRLDPEVLKRFASDVSASGAKYLDLNGMTSGWDDSYFHDAVHVNSKGASETVKWLLAWVGVR